MRIEEFKVRLWRKRWLRTQDNQVFELIWEQVRNLVHVPFGQFPECLPGHWDSIKMTAVLEGLEDYDSKHIVVSQQVAEVPYREETTKTIVVPVEEEQPDGSIRLVRRKRTVKKLGPLKTKMKIIQVQRESEMTLLSFLRCRMENACRNEKRDLLNQRRNIALDSTYQDDDHTKADEICFKSLANKDKLSPIDPVHQEEAFCLLVANVEAKLTAAGETRILRAFRLKLKHPAITNRRIAKTLGVSKTYTSSYFRRLQAVILEVIEETDTLIMQ